MQRYKKNPTYTSARGIFSYLCVFLSQIRLLQSHKLTGFDDFLAGDGEGVEVNLPRNDIHQQARPEVHDIDEHILIHGILVQVNGIGVGNRYIIAIDEASVLVVEREGNRLTDGSHENLVGAEHAFEQDVIRRRFETVVEAFLEIDVIFLPPIELEVLLICFELLDVKVVKFFGRPVWGLVDVVTAL